MLADGCKFQKYMVVWKVVVSKKYKELIPLYCKVNSNQFVVTRRVKV